MRQRRWLELVKDYDCSIHYHPGKANVVTDALSRKTRGEVSSLITEQKQLVDEFARMRIDVITPPKSTEAILATMVVRPTLRDRVKETQPRDKFLSKMRERAPSGSIKGFVLANDGVLTYEGRLCIPKDESLRREILEEAHCAPYAAHPGSTKMYRDLRGVFWWRSMKVKMTFTMDQYAKIYIKEIVRLHGVSVSIVSDRDTRFTSKFWKSLQTL
ncbi:hypothetical protein DH2020_016362 [Rehmannia glutinosa]|uniref:Integrase zinc-binding domain-containing protein n=1 Tax=Rehmannia glutinosa TaxID=99300 RepID=A0ABR0WMX2_REHGL